MKIINNQKRLEQALTQYNIPEHFQFFQEYLPYFHLVKFQKGELIYQTDYQRQYLLFFLSGKIKVCTHLGNGKSLLICFYQTFQLLGDLELYQIDTSTVTAQAIEDCTCISLHVTEIYARLMSDTFFLQFLSKALATKLARSSTNNSINLLYPLENRLASYIYQVCDSNLFSENLTQLSELLGTSYRHLLRTLKKFTSEEILKKGKNGYIIRNRKKLQELAGDLYLT